MEPPRFTRFVNGAVYHEMQTFLAGVAAGYCGRINIPEEVVDAPPEGVRVCRECLRVKEGFTPRTRGDRKW